MSWISGLADKAEDILNKIDKNAATALQIPSNNLSNIVTIPELPKTTVRKKELMLLESEGSSETTVEASKENSERANAARRAAIESISNLELSTSSYDSIKPKTDAVTIDLGVEGSNDSGGKESRINNLRLTDSKMGHQELKIIKIPFPETSNQQVEALHIPAYTPQSHEAEVATLKQRIEELEILTKSLTTECNKTQCKLTETQSVDASYVHSIVELESSLSKLRQEYVDVSQKLQMQIEETTKQRRELQEYRAKAHRALQMKDNLITELQAAVSSGSGSATNKTDGDSSELTCLKIEMQSLREAHKNMQDENVKIQHQLTKTEEDLQKLQKMHSEKLDARLAIEEELRKAVRLEKEHSMRIESENRIISQELSTLQQQMANQLAAATQTLQQKDQLIQQLRAERSENPIDAEFNDCNIRIKSLTQSLVDKQNALESVTADRNALRIQLEKVQDQLRQKNYQSSSNSSSSHRNALLSNTTDDVKAQFPALMRETPFDSRVSRRVKRAYSSLDSAGIRLGAFLRRYPLIRIFVLMYVGLLHVWVVFVLLFSTPT